MAAHVDSFPPEVEKRGHAVLCNAVTKTLPAPLLGCSGASIAYLHADLQPAKFEAKRADYNKV